MIRLQRVLLPTDFSKHAAQAMRYACELAERFEAELHLLHVLEVHVSSTPQFGMGLALPMNIQESEAACKATLDELPGPDCPCTRPVVRAVVHGTAFLEIIRYARDKQIDVIVMGTHGHAGLAHVLLGSVAERVVRKAPCPVLTVRPEGHQFVMP